MRVCVVGAGVSGLPAIKECRAVGLDVVAYERTNDIGGLWNYRPELTDGGTVMKSTVVNTSKEMMAYSDFPPPITFSNFMHHSKVLEYLKSYAKFNNLYNHIRFNTTVQQVSRVNDLWEVITNNGDKEMFDFVMICIGHHSIPYHPHLPGIEKFKGHVLHSHQYRNFKGFEEKDIFIVGIGNSALDIATDLSGVAKSVTISTRRGTWIFNRVNQGGMPYDIKLMTRLYDYMMDILPWTVINDFMEYRLQQRLDHDLYGLRPNHRFFQQHPSLNDDLPNLLCSGRVVVTEFLNFYETHDNLGDQQRLEESLKNIGIGLHNTNYSISACIDFCKIINHQNDEDIECIEEIEVQVKGGRRFPADVIILATGYTFDFPFLRPKSIIPLNDNEVELYKYVFPLMNPTLAVIGLIQPIGSVLPISEIQCRWCAAVFSGQISLPTRSEMMADIKLKRAQITKRYYKSKKHTVQVDYIKYMDEIAEQIGCRPSLRKYLFTDPSFFLRLFVGANAPYVYRLQGPGAWDKAKDTLVTLPDRVKSPLKNRQCPVKRHKRRGKIDEHFRYVSMKWLAGWTCVLLVTGIWVFCSGPRGLATLTYTFYVIVFFIVFSFMLLWFDMQYDMTTIF